MLNLKVGVQSAIKKRHDHNMYLAAHWDAEILSREVSSWRLNWDAVIEGGERLFGPQTAVVLRCTLRAPYHCSSVL